MPIIERILLCAGATTSRGERHDPETHLIRLVLKAAHGETKHVTVFGNDYPIKDGTCVRDYIHVSDLADAHACTRLFMSRQCINRDQPGQREGYSVLEVIEAARTVTGRDIGIDMQGRRAGDPSHLVADAAME